MKNTTLFAAATAAMMFGMPAANAAVDISTSTPAGTFQNLNVVCAGTAPCNFTDTGTFVTPEGSNTITGTISTSFDAMNPSTNVDFSSVLLNGTPFALTPNGMFEFGTLGLTSLIPGATNLLTVNGTTAGNGSYSGTLSFGLRSAVPEPATWALMLLGFGIIGAGMRRQKDAGARLNVSFV